MKRVGDVARRHKHYLLKLDNVVGVGSGYKEVKSIATGEKALVVCVSSKLPESRLTEQQLIPKHLETIRTDVIEVGRFDAYQDDGVDRHGRVRPAVPGVSIGHEAVTCGTFGALVKDKSTGQSLILSNNHILANLTDGSDGRSQIGDPVLQPGSVDGGRDSLDRIGTLYKFVPVYYNNLTVNRVDAALALPLNRRDADGKILGMMVRPRGTLQAQVGMKVYKSGAATGVTSGRVRILDLTVRINYGYVDTAVFDGQILTSKMAEPGDSGSLLVDGRKRAVGLLVGGSFNSVIYNPIKDVLHLLDVSI